MKRKQQIRELQFAEAELVARRQLLQQSAQQRLDQLRALGPYWLIGGGFVAGVLVQRADTLLSGSGVGTPLAIGLRLWPLLSSGMTAGLALSDPKV
ncbi:hypothetical protein Q6D67_11225 [Haliea sp. E1-2-M8]|uniref:hypothetical protein n=1 Tax=Haliea sp. E1-2-M8 TaxID=3064706 RepID=UPI0027165DB7|nr:hypothetical protein [Haliea sp. E1-2-M8]MDO8862275.1 hypothetical protein [Haliea sp. E1-2-M8]